MNQWKPNTKAVNTTIQFVNSLNEFVPPTAATVLASVFDGAGVANPLMLDSPLPVVADSTSLTVTIPAAINTLNVGEILSLRTLKVYWVSNGENYEASYEYGVLDNKYLMLSYDSVRANLGLNNEELTDEQIPLVETAMAVESLHPELTGIFNPLSYSDLRARDYLYLTAALRCIPKLRISLLAGEKTARHNYTRQNINWDEVSEGLREQADKALNEATGEGSFSSSVFLLATPTDKVTG